MDTCPFRQVPVLVAYRPAVPRPQAIQLKSGAYFLPIAARSFSLMRASLLRPGEVEALERLVPNKVLHRRTEATLA
jgi:hypothetical protein